MHGLEICTLEAFSRWIRLISEEVCGTGDTGRIYRWNGTSWTNDTQGGESDHMQRAKILNQNLAYVVGFTSSIWKWNGTSWSNESAPSGDTNHFYGLDILSSSFLIIFI